ncbi:hypothetical protein F2Q69_00043913 [Brassica cretica]|uniref:Uncharacterized protein n=1 Tax=Brassica cretica TaxID=69181 RepID=A0A8S9ND45_BRACR|nr:hypothetical protein F2Q69_00043913 [Brassica cretica]
MSFAELVFVQGLLGRFGRAIGILEEVFYACDLRDFAGEELRSKPCAENLAVHSGMTLIFSLVVDIPVVTRVFPSRGRLLRVVLLGEDFHLFFHHDEVCCLVKSVLDFGSTTISGVGLSAGKAMDSGTMSPSGFVAWAIGIQEEVFYACDLQNFAGEELRSKPCTENLAVHSGMTSGLVELAVGIILELVPGPARRDKGIASKGPRIVLRELRRGFTVPGWEVSPRPWAR